MAPRQSTTSASALRRTFLGASAAGAAGLILSDLVRAETALPNSPPGKAKRVILIFNCGAPSHVDLWDMKPRAADNVRGLYQPISTNVPGIEICELMPNVARHADKLAIVRSVHHQHTSHNSGMYWSIVGRPYRVDSTTLNPSRTDFPSIGTLVGWLALRDGYSGPMPPYVITPHPHGDSRVYLTPGQFGSCLGLEYDPFVLNADPNAANFSVPNLRLVEGLTQTRIQRGELLGQVDRDHRWDEAAGRHDLESRRETAASLVTSPEVARAFDLSQEPVKTREAYGRHTWGQSHLLARRLIEAGTRFVTTTNGRSIIWDTHNDNFGRLKNVLVPPMEQAFAALLDDLSVMRGMLDSTLVVWMGDFGRTPLINKDAGRDHWPQCYSVVLAGGGIRGGQIVGQSDSIGAFPVARPVTPADIHATIFAALGYTHQNITYQSADGRPMPLCEGKPIQDLL